MLLACAALGACGRGAEWVKPGAGEADSEAAKERCSTLARAADPAAPAAVALGDENPPPSGGGCVGASYGATANCAPSGMHVATASTEQPVSPLAADQRASVFEGCMADAGFRLRPP